MLRNVPATEEIGEIIRAILVRPIWQSARLPCSPLLSDEVQRQPPGMRMRAVFPQVNPLPCAERQPAAVNRNGKIHRRQRRADVRRHVVLALGGVNKQRVTIRNQPREKGIQIAPHIRIGVFLDQKRGRSMAQMQRDQAVAELVGGNPPLNVPGKFRQTTSVGGDDEFMKRLAHGRLKGSISDSTNIEHPTSMATTREVIGRAFAVDYWSYYRVQGVTGAPFSASIFSRSGLRGCPASSAFW